MPTIEGIKKYKATKSFYEFFKQAFVVMEPETPYKDNWHIEYLCNELQEAVERIANKKIKLHDIVCNVPPGSSKSLIFSISLIAWSWITWPHLRFAVASYTDALSLYLSVKCRDLIASEWYQDNWGDKYTLKHDENTKSFFKNTKGGYRIATTVGGTSTGFHVDVFIGDDLVSAAQGDSEALRQTANDFWFVTVPSRFKNPEQGLKILVMQRLHEEDTAGQIRTRGLNYKWIVIPAELSSDNVENLMKDEVLPIDLCGKYVENLFFPERFSKKTLEEYRTTLGSLRYTGQYLQRPSPADGSIIKKHWFKYFYSNDLPNGITKHYYSDTAYGRGIDSSATICFSVYKGNLYIWDIWKVDLIFPKYIQGIKDFLRRSGYTDSSKVVYEPKATGWSVIQQLQSEKLSDRHERMNIIVDESIVKFKGKKIKALTMDKVSRVKIATPKIEAGRVYLLSDSPWVSDFLDECLAFPAGAHDDQVDALAGATRMMDTLTEGVSIGFA